MTAAGTSVCTRDAPVAFASQDSTSSRGMGKRQSGANALPLPTDAAQGRGALVVPLPNTRRFLLESAARSLHHGRCSLVWQLFLFVLQLPSTESQRRLLPPFLAREELIFTVFFPWSFLSWLRVRSRFLCSARARICVRTALQTRPRPPRVFVCNQHKLHTSTHQ